MVVSNRLAYVRRCIEKGQMVHMTASTGACHGQAKVKFLVDHGQAKMSPVTRRLLLSFLDTALEAATINVSADRRHRQSSGISEIAIWVSEASAGREPPSNNEEHASINEHATVADHGDSGVAALR